MLVSDSSLCVTIFFVNDLCFTGVDITDSVYFKCSAMVDYVRVKSNH